MYLKQTRNQNTELIYELNKGIGHKKYAPKYDELKKIKQESNN